MSRIRQWFKARDLERRRRQARRMSTETVTYMAAEDFDEFCRWIYREGE